MRCTERVQFVEAINDPRVAALVAQNEAIVGGIHCNIEALKALESLGKLFCWLIKSDGDTVGHCAMVLDNGTATQIALFVAENNRKCCIARRALSEIDKDLIDLGASRIIRQVRSPHRGPGYVHGLGYEELETLYVLNVGG